MPEGDTVYRTAKRLNEALRGSLITEWDLRVPRSATSDLRGLVVDEVVSRGKHLLHHVGDYTLHSHLKMEGSWHLYRPGTAWRRPAYQARAIVSSTEWVTVGFELGVVELIARADEHTVVGHLGPDLLGPSWDPDDAVARVAAHPEQAIAVALLDQRNLAGLGNEYVNELCFLRGTLPDTPVGEADVAAAVSLAHRLIVANRDRLVRTTTGDTRPGRQTWVYSREGQLCRRCGTRIQKGTLGAKATELRDSFWCPHCQC